MDELDWQKPNIHAAPTYQFAQFRDEDGFRWTVWRDLHLYSPEKYSNTPWGIQTPSNMEPKFFDNPLPIYALIQPLTPRGY